MAETLQSLKNSLAKTQGGLPPFIPQITDPGLHPQSKILLEKLSKMKVTPSMPAAQQLYATGVAAGALRKNFPTETDSFKQLEERIKNQKDFFSRLAAAQKMKEANVLTQATGNLPAALDRLPSDEDYDFSIMRMASNVPKDFINIFKGLSTAIHLMVKGGISLATNKSADDFKKDYEFIKDRLPLLKMAFTEMVDPYKDLLFGKGQKFQRYMEEHPVAFANDLSMVLSLGSSGLMRTSTALSALATTEKTAAGVAKIAEAANVFKTLSKVTNPAAVFGAPIVAGRKLVSTPTEKIVKFAEKFPKLGQAALSTRETLGGLATFNPELKKFRALLREMDSLSTVEQADRITEISEAIRKVKNNEEMELIISHLQGTTKKGEKLSGDLEDVLATLKKVASKDEERLKVAGAFTADLMERRKFQPLMQQTGKSLKELKETLPAGEFPVYWEHLFDNLDEAGKVKWDRFKGVGRALPVSKTTRVPGFAQKSLGKEGYIADKNFVYAFASAKRVQWMNYIEKVKAIASRGKAYNPGDELLPGHVIFNPNAYVRPVDDALEVGNVVLSAVGKGKTHVGEMMDDVMAALYKRSAELQKYDPLGDMGATVQIPKWMANEIEGNIVSRLLDEHILAKTSTSIFSAWRLAVLPLNPKWNINNLIGNTILLTLSGAKPKHIIQAFMKSTRDMVPATVKAGVAEFEREILNRGATLPSEVSDFVLSSWGEKRSKLLTPIYKAADFGLAVNKKVDEFARTAKFMTAFEKELMRAKLLGTGKQFEKAWQALKAINNDLSFERSAEVVEASRKAADATADFFGNYGLLGPTERAIARSGAIPFYPWLKHINTLALTLPIKYPGRMELLRYISQTAIDMSDAEYMRHGVSRDDMPIYLQGEIPIGRDAETGLMKFISMPSANPFVNLASFTGEISLSPLIMSLIEASTGVDLFTQKQIVLPGEWLDSRSGKLFEADREGNSRLVEQTSPRFAATLYNQFINSLPQVGMVNAFLFGNAKYVPGLPNLKGNLFDPITGKPKDDASVLKQMGKFFGYPVKEWDVKKIIAASKAAQRRATVGHKKQLFKNLQIEHRLRDEDK